MSKTARTAIDLLGALAAESRAAAENGDPDSATDTLRAAERFLERSSDYLFLENFEERLDRYGSSIVPGRAVYEIEDLERLIRLAREGIVKP